MKTKWIIIPISAVIFLNLNKISFAANFASHTVTVKVQLVDEISMTQNNIMVPVNTPNHQSMTSMENEGSNLSWISNETDKKITVCTDQETADVNLKAAAKYVSGGQASSESVIGTEASDLITGTDTLAGHCNLQYSAIDPSVEDNEIDARKVTLTFTDS